MIVEQLKDKSLQLFEQSRNKNSWNFVLFFSVFFLALSMCKNNFVRQAYMKTNAERMKLLNDYYFESLYKAINQVKQKEQETKAMYDLRVQKQYHINRYESFIKLQEFVRNDYALIYKVFKEKDIDKEKREHEIEDAGRIFAILKTDY